MSYCAKCGSPIPPGAQFCPKCGTPLNVAPAGTDAGVAAGSKPALRSAWWIVPLALLVLGGLAWLILAGLPFRRGDARPAPPAVETIAEGTAPPAAPGGSGTIVDVPGGETPPDEMPPRETPPRETPPREVPDPQPALLNDEQASATLRDFVTSRKYYDVASECVRIESRGFRNRGYDYEVWHSCESSGASRLLGRWRVDAKTREVFRRYEDGRYLRP